MSLIQWGNYIPHWRIVSETYIILKLKRDVREKLVPFLYVADEKRRLQELPVVTEHLGAIPGKRPSLLTLCSADLA